MREPKPVVLRKGKTARSSGAIERAARELSAARLSIGLTVRLRQLRGCGVICGLNVRAVQGAGRADCLTEICHPLILDDENARCRLAGIR